MGSPAHEMMINQKQLLNSKQASSKTPQGFTPANNLFFKNGEFYEREINKDRNPVADKGKPETLYKYNKVATPKEFQAEKKNKPVYKKPMEWNKVNYGK